MAPGRLKGAYVADIVLKKTSDGPDVSTLNLPTHQEHAITARADCGDTMQKQLQDAVTSRDASVLGQFVFAGCRHYERFRSTFEDAPWPSSWLQGDACQSGEMLSMQVTAISGLPTEAIELNGRKVGFTYEDEYARYCRLGGLTPPSADLSRGEQTQIVFEDMKAALAMCDMPFNDTVRTWLYLDDLLAWYDDFNRVRTDFFEAHGVFDKMVPASTGIGASNPAGTAIMADCFAVHPKSKAMTIQAVPSPLQCSAEDYRSSFSRAVELGYPTHRSLSISGTASIDPEGHSVHLGDAAAQISLTMQVIEALLVSRQMGWSDVNRGIAYFKDSADIPLFADHCEDHGIAPLPVAISHADVCRDDLLFEIEVDAIKPTGR